MSDAEPTARRPYCEGKDGTPGTRCLHPINCAQFGCLNIQNAERREQIRRQPLVSKFKDEDTIETVAAGYISEVERWMAMMIEFMNLKLAQDPDYEILGGLMKTVGFARTIPGTPAGAVFSLIHFHRWNSHIPPAMALAAAREGHLAALPPEGDDPPPSDI